MGELCGDGDMVAPAEGGEEGKESNMVTAEGLMDNSSASTIMGSVLSGGGGGTGEKLLVIARVLVW